MRKGVEKMDTHNENAFTQLYENEKGNLPNLYADVDSSQEIEAGSKSHAGKPPSYPSSPNQFYAYKKSLSKSDKGRM